MTRVRKNTVDHFLHDCKLGQTMFIIEQRWGNDGYAFWFKLLELLGDTEDHALDAGKPEVWAYLTAKTRTTDQTATDILDLLAKLDAIDLGLWGQCKIIWSQKFVDRLSEVYRKRTTKTPQKPLIRDGYPKLEGLSGAVNPLLSEVKCIKRSEVKESLLSGKPDDTHLKNSELKKQAIEVLEHLNKITGHSYRQVDGNLDFISARLKSGATVQNCKTVIAKKWLQWKNQPEMQQYLRPATLFNKSKFEQYLGENVNIGKENENDTMPPL